MTAAELFTVYGPVNEKIPDTVPRKGFLHMAFIDAEWWWTAESTGRVGLSIPPTEAAALLQAFALKWLLARGAILISGGPGEYGVYASKSRNCTVAPSGQPYIGPTLHHALAAACLTAAEEKPNAQ